MEKIDHEGIVTNINGSEIQVTIVAKAACAGCAIKSSCNPSDAKEKNLKVHSNEANSFAIGDKVIVSISSGQGLYAVLISYILPVIIIFATLIILLNYGFDEGLSALISLVLAIAYFIILYLLRKKTERKFNFNIRKS